MWKMLIIIVLGEVYEEVCCRIIFTNIGGYYNDKKCNHKCVHCYNVWRNDDENDEVIKVLSDEQIRRIIKELVDNNVWRVTITGGEPLSQVDVLYKLIVALKKKVYY